MTSSLIQPYIDKENTSHAGIFSKGKLGFSTRTGTTVQGSGTAGAKFVGKSFNEASISSVIQQTPRRALGDVNRDVSQPLHQKSSLLKPLGQSQDFSKIKDGKIPVLQMKPPAPAKPVPIRNSAKPSTQSVKKTKKSSLLQPTNVTAEKSISSCFPLIHDDIEHMSVYQETEEEYEEMIFPKRERPSTFLYGLGEWRPTQIVEDSEESDDDTECSRVLFELPEELARPPQIDDSLEDNMFEISLEPDPENIPLPTLDDEDEQLFGSLM